ncbi:MAG: hypothetical protein GX376_01575 [Firmicutes bacterium]|nr:hypothetical protein [Bacillota bacterium]
MFYLIGFLLLFILSLAERVRVKGTTGTEGRELPMEPRPSPFSLALGELLAVAGGIYLALLMAVTFLGLEIPTRISFGTFHIEPLAAVSLVLALIQPLLARLWPRC